MKKDGQNWKPQCPQPIYCRNIYYGKPARATEQGRKK